jgi:hypothetical protein
MKKLLLITVLVSLVCGWQSDFMYLVDTDKPVGEVVQRFGDRYHCLVSSNELPARANVISIVPRIAELGSFHDYKKTADELYSLEQAYPDLCEVYDIGDSVEGRDILALRFQPKKPSPGILFVGEHHAREWMSVEVPLALAKYLLVNPKNDPRVKRWLETYDIWIVPMLNPDGHQFSIEKDRLWRKNRKIFQGAVGVDLNRNYDYKWGNMGATTNTSAETFQGKSAFSEPETQVIRDLASGVPFLGAITYHTYGNMILYSWGYGYGDAPYGERLERIAVAMAKLSGKKKKASSANPQSIVKDYFYDVLQASDLYPASGDMCDYMYSTYGTPTFTYEMTSSGLGFINLDEEIQPTVDLVVPMSLELFDATAKEYCIIEGRVTDNNGNPLSVDLNFKNIEFPMKSDPQTGRYYRIVPRGEFYLRYKDDGKDKFLQIKLDKMINHCDIVIGKPKIFTVSGNLFDMAGNPTKATVELQDIEGNILKTSNSETFRFVGLDEGHYKLKVYGQDKTQVYEVDLVRDMEFSFEID